MTSKNGILPLGIHKAGKASAETEVSIAIDTGKPGPVINRNIYSQFAEHLGTGIYEGIWVGLKSKIPNTKGWRNDVVGALKNLHVPLVRWPGGCFADEYHWKDGVGPANKRPVKVNTNWGGVEESNAVGTHEFFDLIELIGAEAYVNGNLGSGSVQEMSEWLEYMTSDSKSALASMRRSNGREKPFKIAYFAVGNEAWGCGGGMTPEHYADLYRQYASFLKAPAGSRPKFVASGGYNDDTTWTDVLSKKITCNIDAISFHYYTNATGKWEAKGAATGFGEDQWISTLSNALRIEELIANNLSVLEKNDPAKKIGFYVDEWGTWYDAEPGTNALFLHQQNTLRDALVAALHFNIFHIHAARVHMTNIAQMVNVLQATILTEKDRFLLTPTYHAFEMYVPFQDATSMPVVVANNSTYRLGEISIPQVSASAARGKDGKLYLALVNTNPHSGVDVTINVSGAKASGLKGRVLTGAAMDAHNTFENAQAVRPAPFTAVANDEKLTVNVPSKAVMVVAVE